MSSKLSFTDGERVLCYHGPLLYEAKCIGTELLDTTGTKKEPRYYIHYNGWNKGWDEWVYETRILKYNDENRRFMRELEENLRKSKSKVARVMPLKRKPGEEEGKNLRKRGRTEDAAANQEESELQPAEVKIIIPEDLKRQLVDDWDFVTRQKKLVGLPREPTVEKVLEDFEKYASGRGPISADTLHEAIVGLIVYFDHALGTLLLYKFERPQYAELLERTPDANASTVYGAEHLLRLFVKLPALLADVRLTTEAATTLESIIADLLKYMQANAASMFMSEYDNASPEYARIAASG
eukprot:Opistho-2@36653